MGLEANDVQCFQVPIIDDAIFEDVEQFDAVLDTEGLLDPAIQPGDITTTVVLIDDQGMY